MDDNRFIDDLNLLCDQYKKRVEELEKMSHNAFEAYMSPCEEHSGENTPPLPEFVEKYGRKCVICLVDRVAELEAENKRLTKICEQLDKVSDGYSKAIHEGNKVIDALRKRVVDLEAAVIQAALFARCWQPDEIGPMCRQFGEFIGEMDKAIRGGRNGE